MHIPCDSVFILDDERDVGASIQFSDANKEECLQNNISSERNFLLKFVCHEYEYNAKVTRNL